MEEVRKQMMSKDALKNSGSVDENRQNQLVKINW